MIPDYLKNDITGLNKHEKIYNSILGKERITVFAPSRFTTNNDYWDQFIPDPKVQSGFITKGEREYKYVGKEIIHIEYDLEPKIEQRPDVRKLASCPHSNCIYCLQIKNIKTHFENGIYRSIKVGDFFTFAANANLIQAVIWVEKGKAQIYAYEGNREFMSSEIIDKSKPATVFTHGRKESRSIKVYARPDDDETMDNITRLWIHISRYCIDNWP